MKRLHFSSFRQRLNAAFLAVSLVPMLLCSGLLLQIFRLRMMSNAQQTAQQQLSASCEALDTLHSGFCRQPHPCSTIHSLHRRCLTQKQRTRRSTASCSTLQSPCAALHALTFTISAAAGAIRHRQRPKSGRCRPTGAFYTRRPAPEPVFWCAARQKIRPTQTSRFCTLRCS